VIIAADITSLKMDMLSTGLFCRRSAAHILKIWDWL